MTVTNTANEWPYTGDGATTDFDYQNKIFAATDLEVYLDAVLQAPLAGYTVTNVGASAGGQVQFAAAPAAGVEILVKRNVPQKQLTDYINGGGIDLESLEAGFDRAVILIQQLQAQLGRQLRQQDGDAKVLAAMPLLATFAGKGLGFTADDPPAPVPIDGSVPSSIVSAFMATVLDDLTGDAALTTLGGGATGIALLKAATAAAARAALAVYSQTEADAAVRDRFGFAVTAQAPETLSVDVAAGAFFDGATGLPVAKAATAAGPIVAPAADPRSDIVYLDRRTGVPGIATGAEAAMPADPVLPPAKLPLARINATVGMTEIVAGDLDDLRGLDNIGQTGRVLQTVEHQDGAVATGTTTIPNDNTIPQSGEGTQFMALAVTPLRPDSRLRIDVVANLTTSAAGLLAAALFRDAGANALAAVQQWASSNLPIQHNFSYDMASPGIAATTFKVRAGCSAAGTTTFNGVSGAGKLGGVEISSIFVTEYMP